MLAAGCAFSSAEHVETGVADVGIVAGFRDRKTQRISYETCSPKGSL